MCSAHRTRLVAVAAILTLATTGCEPSGQSAEPSVDVPERAGAMKTTALARAERRAFDGAPPVIPHQNFGMKCIACHSQAGLNVPGVGFAPPSPHEHTPGMSAMSNCKQCHVFHTTKTTFVENTFTGLRQDLRKGDRLHALAPPVLPHPVQMRENCAACHSGPAAREEIRCTHPERRNCVQCHVEVKEVTMFARD